MRRSIIIAAFHSYFHRLGLVFAVALLILGGCGVQDAGNPLGPDTSPQSGVAAKRALSALESVTASATTADPILRTENIDATTGGNVVINTDGLFDYKLKIPAGALKRNTRITMTVPDPNEAQVILEPHGLVFNIPVKLEMTAFYGNVRLLNPSTNSDPEGIYWFNEGSGNWEYQSSDVTIFAQSKRMTAEAEPLHFSRYALGGDKAVR